MSSNETILIFFYVYVIFRKLFVFYFDEADLDQQSMDKNLKKSLVRIAARGRIDTVCRYGEGRNKSSRETENLKPVVAVLLYLNFIFCNTKANASFVINIGLFSVC